MKNTDKDKLRQRIKDIDGLTTDERSALLDLLEASKTYGLVWENKLEFIEEKLREEIPVLKELTEFAIISDNRSAPNHILIEGDNLESLVALTYTHSEKVDLIYIDPPYNTGSKDFIYNDSYVDADDTYRHSKWLSFISKRLRIAKKLLADHGVLFISIGDDEIGNLKLLTDEMFQPIALVPRIAKKGSNQGTYFRPTKDYLLVCCKNIEAVHPFIDATQTSDLKKYKFIEESTGRRFRKGHSFYQASLDPLRGCKNQRYYMEAPDGTLIIPPGENFPTKNEDAAFIAPVTRNDKVWRWSYQSYQKKKSKIIFAKTKRSPLVDNHGNPTQWNVYEKKYADEEKIVNTTLPNDVITDYINTLGTSLLGDMQINFSYSKPVELIKYLISICQLKKDITVLDFFAGSGSTLHAVMQLNEKDGGTRRCILCTNNENGICQNVTYERNKKVITGYIKPDGTNVDGLTNNNLRYYRTDLIGRRRTPQNMRRLMLLSTGMICIKENVFTEVNNFHGLSTLENGFRYYNDNGKALLIIYNEETLYPIIDILETIEVTQPIAIYIFCPGADAWDLEFENVSDKVRLVAVPSSIYNAYRRVLPDPKDHFILAEETAEEISQIISSEDNDSSEEE